MRLTCPNCGAEYEVPDEVIPAAGRDVQCSNCGVTWFQHHPDNMPEDEPDETPVGTDASAPPDSPDEHDDETAFDDLSEVYDEDEDDEGPSPQPPQRRRSLAPEVSSILREEAQYEERARTQETLESQPDLGLDEPQQSLRTDKADDRLSRLREESRDEPHPTPADHAPAAAATAASRRDLLPDIEEINSSLRRKGDRMRSGGGRDTQRPDHKTRQGTRRGFITVLVVLILGATLYLMAPKIGAAVPQLNGLMTSYVLTVDRGRAWLDTKAEMLAAKLDEMSDDTPEEAPTDVPDPAADPASDN